MATIEAKKYLRAMGPVKIRSAANMITFILVAVLILSTYQIIHGLIQTPIFEWGNEPNAKTKIFGIFIGLVSILFSLGVRHQLLAEFTPVDKTAIASLIEGSKSSATRLEIKQWLLDEKIVYQCDYDYFLRKDAENAQKEKEERSERIISDLIGEKDKS